MAIDGIAFILLEIAFIEVVVIIIQLVMFGRKPKQTRPEVMSTREESRRAHLEEIEKEAEAIVSAGKKLKRR